MEPKLGRGCAAVKSRKRAKVCQGGAARNLRPDLFHAKLLSVRVTVHRTVILLLALLGVLLVGGLGVAWALIQDTVGHHPAFGPIRATLAADLNSALSDPVGKILRRLLPAAVVAAPAFPHRFKDQPRYLQIEGHRMEWSIGSATTGWLYFHAPATWPSRPEWEFAPSKETNLLQIGLRDLPQRFYGQNASNLALLFGLNSNTNALNVREGQVLFARQVGETNRISILQLARQDGNQLLVHYCSTSQAIH